MIQSHPCNVKYGTDDKISCIISLIKSMFGGLRRIMSPKCRYADNKFGVNSIILTITFKIM